MNQNQTIWLTEKTLGSKLKNQTAKFTRFLDHNSRTRFSLECNVCWKLKCQWYFHIQAKTYIEWIKFLSKPNKISFLELFELTRLDLFSKIGLVTFLVLWPFNFTQKINSILKSCVANGRAVKRKDELIEYFH